MKIRMPHTFHSNLNLAQSFVFRAAIEFSIPKLNHFVAHRKSVSLLPVCPIQIIEIPFRPQMKKKPQNCKLKIRNNINVLGYGMYTMPAREGQISQTLATR